MIRRAILKTKSPLSQREREIARLSKERLSVKEIAGKLFISEATVRTIQRNVYRKLDIHMKSELYTIEL
jgi:LuxR family maltose regulon positive regulatory protein